MSIDEGFVSLYRVSGQAGMEEIHAEEKVQRSGLKGNRGRWEKLGRGKG